jgi:histidinol dehydrogenase
VITCLRADGSAEFSALKNLEERAEARDREAEAVVAAILEAVQRDGDAALRRCGEQFDGGLPEERDLGAAAMKAAFESADEGFRGALTRAADNIRRYHERQVAEGYEIRREGGVVLGQTIMGLERVGLYVPGGAASYPSTVLMNAIPARLAGVKELILLTPPALCKGKDGRTRRAANPDVLAAAFAAGVDRVVLAGGAQAIAALAYGTESIPRVDKIVGPGNLYVATAKRMLFGKVDIDMIAGPSEILVMADAGAEPAWIAADMLSQAEHDANAAAILLTTSAQTAERTLSELTAQVEALERREIIRASLKDFGLAVICRSAEEMADLANRIAPEHLEILMEAPMEMLAKIKNAGSVFCGPYSPEPLGDYYAGPNHVLPTSGSARFASPLGVYDFVKRMSYTHYTKEALAAAKEDILQIAGREGLTAHARAVSIRFETDG